MRASRQHSADTLAPGQRIGPFVLLAPLGSGGSGRIWAVARVGQLGFSKRMALKIMRNDKLSSARARERFDREAHLCGRLSHPSVRAVHDLGSHEGRPFMAMSWVDTSLAELLEHAPGRSLDPMVVCWVGMQCCSALAAAHGFEDEAGAARAIVHRDVSPGNILLTVDGHALLADLTAPATEPDASPGAPPVGPRFFGSLGYASPEALRQEPLDGRADLFSLGCVLYEALAGVPAFEGDDEHSLVFQILEGGPLDLAARSPGAGAALAAVVERCLERRREHRFQSAHELQAALSSCCSQHSTFTLEQRSAALIREVLGARIREREEAMHLAFQRFGPSAFERTDTLPITAGAVPSSRPPSIVAIQRTDGDGNRDLSHSGAGVAISQRHPRKRRSLWIAAAIIAACLLGLCTVQTWPRRGADAAAPGAPQASLASSPEPFLPSQTAPAAPLGAREAVAPAGTSDPARGSQDTDTRSLRPEPSMPEHAAQPAVPAPGARPAPDAAPASLPPPAPARKARALRPRAAVKPSAPAAPPVKTPFSERPNPYVKIREERARQGAAPAKKP